ncbi:uncharacterized protein LOC142564087 [Dermacentor variabilis]|uniref:uncharacterized protein LOC142564087 n=1 Tax=Dermacentor variabilis TaxID=34621 RepID=UPI003F5C224A
MARPNDAFRIWQWNCRSFALKKASLQQYLCSHEAKLHVILLQETVNCNAYCHIPWISVVTRTLGRTRYRDKISCLAYDLDRPEIEYVMVEILPGSVSRRSVYILNVYSNPRNHRQWLKRLFQKAIRLPGSNPLVIAGDFNAAHRTWNYAYYTPEGNELCQNANYMDLTLITGKAFPTRTGTSTQRDTSPDLYFVNNIADARWSNLAVDLSSNHFLLAVHFPTIGRRSKLYTWVDWDLFRKTRAELLPPDDAPNLETPTAQLKADIAKATKTIGTDLSTEKMDSRLAQLLEAKQSLLASWKDQRLNRRLCRRISELNNSIVDHCHTLSKEQWDEICNSINGQVRNGKTWNLLKHLLDDTNTRTKPHQSLANILHQDKRTAPPEYITKTLIQKYILLPTGPLTPHPEYTGPDNTLLDASFSAEEVRRALHEVNDHSAPGPDGITNKLLRNLDAPSVIHLTDTINEVWKKGELPDAWKLAHAIFIPKPGKDRSIGRFDDIAHSSILKAVTDLGLGRRFYDFARSFLTRRKAGLQAGGLVSEAVELSTQFRTVLSPMLFNLAMIRLSERLSKIHWLNHTIYADDITIWCSAGSDGFIESALQEAFEIAESYLQQPGLKCSPTKLELLLYLPKRRGAKPRGWKTPAERNITLRTRDGRTVPKVDSIRVLGMIIESHRANTQTVQKLKTKTENAIRVKLLELGVHNTLEEIDEAQEGTQVNRLTITKAGRHILRELVFYSSTTRDPKLTPVPRDIRDFTFAPNPRNIYPDHNRGRRLARATALLQRIDMKADDVTFVEASAYHKSRAFAAVAVPSTQ